MSFEALKSGTRSRGLRFSKRHPKGEPGATESGAVPTGEIEVQGTTRTQEGLN